MDHAQSRVTVLDGVHNDPYGKQIINLVKCLVLVDHLSIDAEKVLDPPVYRRLDAGFHDMRFHFIHNRLNISFPHTLPCIDLFHQIIVSFRLQVFEGQIVQLHLDLADAKPVGDGRIDIERLPRDALLLFRRHKFQRPHIVQSVRQLDDNDPYVFRHR